MALNDYQLLIVNFQLLAADVHIPLQIRFYNTSWLMNKYESMLINGLGGGLIGATAVSPSLWKFSVSLFILLVGVSAYRQKQSEEN